MEYFIGIDWGVRKIGVAFGDNETCQSFSYGLLKNDDNIFEKLNDIAEKYESKNFVVGFEQNKIYNDNSKKIVNFVNKLSVFSDKKVTFSPEMFTTREAQNNLKSANKKKLAKKDDVEAARIILQNFLDTNFEN